ncbi:hypothetical protein GOBAR_DD07035 [Gossypium barbadense]|nr:hypothetical protein GOBAR_DD07035 [Gossypium barbadense]
MKFGKEFASQMVLEWQAAYMDYACLKIILKQIQHWKQKTTQPDTPPHTENQPILVNFYETTFLMAAEEGGECEQQFFRRIDNELNKVDKFYRSKVKEVMDEAHTLSKQTDAFIAFRIKVDKVAAKFDHIHPSPSKQIFEEENSKHMMSSDISSLNILNHVKLNEAIQTHFPTTKQTELNFSKENLKRIKKQLKQAFIEFYHKLRLLKKYSFMNILAFSKIMKKYDKISSRRASRNYMRIVDNSYLGSSDEVTKLMERVEATFIKHFSNLNHCKGMNKLRPKTKKERHRISFCTGLFVGCTAALILALILIIHALNILGKQGKAQYMENMFPLYSVFAFIVLHMNAANIFFWRRYRINYTFIFDFKQGTELGYRGVLLLSFGLAALALASVISNLDMEMDPKTGDYKALTELLPLILVTLALVILIFPFNILYRSSRLFFLTILFHCICAPLYKVKFQDFFLADQLTSQVQALRSLRFYICYYGWGDYKHRQNICKMNDAFNTFYFVVAVVPYWSRLLQCLRRLHEEKDPMTAYSLHAGTGDKLLIPYKGVYFRAMALNILLRFAWMQTVLNFKVLEIIRRGIWNFFRLENEHLNNVGKFRAFKSVPLPFNYEDDEDRDV